MTTKEAADLLRSAADDAYSGNSMDALMGIVLNSLLKDLCNRITTGVQFETVVSCLLDDRSYIVEGLQEGDWEMLKNFRIPDTSLVHTEDGIDCVLPTRSDDRNVFDPMGVGVENQRLIVVSINNRGVLVTSVELKRADNTINAVLVHSLNMWMTSLRKWVKVTVRDSLEAGWTDIVQQSVRHVLGALLENHRKTTPSEVFHTFSKIGDAVVPTIRHAYESMPIDPTPPEYIKEKP